MANELSKVKHLVVLMLENRSFDHLPGYLKANGIKPAVDGLTGTETNPTNPVTGTGPVAVTPSAGDGQPKPESGHELADVSEQYYGHVDLTFPAGGPMNGFVANYANQPTVPPPTGPEIMKCVDPTAIPALVGLAAQFCVCDRWHASVPGSTWPNRMFAHAATSAGTVTNVLGLYFLPTIFDRLGLAGKDWRIYYHQIPQAVLFASLFGEWVLSPVWGRFRLFKQWKTDLAAPSCSLPEYTFVEPAYFSFKLGKKKIYANDQHPSHSIALADQLVRDVYEPLRASPCWAHSMLVIVHDEHGGTYDHRFPNVAAVNPDGLVSSPSSFNFTRYGARVPAVIVSPWAANGVCSTLYDHTSIAATLEQRFGLLPLTLRDAAATPLGDCLTASAPRLTDAAAPLKLPPAAMMPSAARRKTLNPRAVPLSTLQRTLVALADQIRIPGEKRSRVRPLERIRTEQGGGEFVEARVRALIQAAAKPRVAAKPRPRVRRLAGRRGRRRAR
jgi:phospholipase C